MVLVPGETVELTLGDAVYTCLVRDAVLERHHFDKVSQLEIRFDVLDRKPVNPEKPVSDVEGRTRLITFDDR